MAEYIFRFFSDLHRYQQQQWENGEPEFREDFINGDKFLEHLKKYDNTGGGSPDVRKDPLKNGIFFSCATDGLGLGDRCVLQINKSIIIIITIITIITILSLLLLLLLLLLLVLLLLLLLLLSSSLNIH